MGALRCVFGAATVEGSRYTQMVVAADAEVVFLFDVESGSTALLDGGASLVESVGVKVVFRRTRQRDGRWCGEFGVSGPASLLEATRTALEGYFGVEVVPVSRLK